MEIKKYNLYPTVKKTIKENNLVVADYGENVLLDLSLLDFFKEQEEYEAIVNNIAKYHIFHDRYGVFYVNWSEYKWFEVRCEFVRHNVYNPKTWSRRYVIVELVRVKITKVERHSIYDKNGDITEILENRNYHGEPVEDIEI